jgi:hypothetical protein
LIQIKAADAAVLMVNAANGSRRAPFMASLQQLRAELRAARAEVRRLQAAFQRRARRNLANPQEQAPIFAAMRAANRALHRYTEAQATLHGAAPGAARVSATPGGHEQQTKPAEKLTD